MRYLSLGVLLCAITLLAVPAEAQGGRDVGRGGPGARGAEFFLARTGDLRLTDAQVVRLAAIARRAADRRRAMRAIMDSVAPARRGGMRMDSTDRAARTREMERVRARFDREREQGRTDLRDAIAVLTPEQQAMAWEMAASGPPGARGARFRREGGPGRERRGREGRQPPRGQRPPQ
jgi:Spy/CpxP family protein refolding chaperone